MPQDLFEQAITISRKPYKERSLAVYRSLWKRVATGLADAQPPFSDDQLRAAIRGCGAYATQKKALGLYKWVADTLRFKGIELGEAYQAVSRDYFQKAQHSYQLTTEASLIEQMAARAREVSGWKGIRLEALLRVMWDCGPRQAELLGLQWSDIQESSSTVKLALGKKKSSRQLEVSPSTWGALQTWREVSPCPDSALVWVADAEGRKLDASTLWRQIKRIEEACGSVDSRLSGPTAFRAAFAARLVEQGVPFDELQEKLGHVVGTSTEELLKQLGAE